MGLPLRAAKAFSFDEVIGDFDEELRSMNSPEKKSRWLMLKLSVKKSAMNFFLQGKRDSCLSDRSRD